MMKPWDNEPAPATKQAVIDTHGHWTFELRDRMANLERRMRHAERLLELCAGHTLTKYREEALSHIEAARQEDGT
jgi:hypothetical protein